MEEYIRIPSRSMTRDKRRHRNTDTADLIIRIPTPGTGRFTQVSPLPFSQSTSRTTCSGGRSSCQGSWSRLWRQRSTEAK